MRVFVRHSTGERSGTETVLCKVRQRGAAWTVTWCRVGQTSFGLGISPQPVNDDASLGVDTCDVLDAYFRCFTKRLPAPGGANVLRAWRTQNRAYRNILKEPGGFVKIARECGMALERIRSNAHKSPRYKDCLKSFPTK